MIPGVLSVKNPSTGVEVATLNETPESDLDSILARSSLASAAIALIPLRERAAILRRFSGLCTAHRGDISEIMTAESGKPLRESLGEIAYATSYLDFYAEPAFLAEAEARQRRSVPNPFPSDHSLSVSLHPVGACGLITPW